MSAARGFVFWKKQMQEEKCLLWQESFKENNNFRDQENSVTMLGGGVFRNRKRGVSQYKGKQIRNTNIHAYG